MVNIGFKGKNIIDIIKYRYVWLGISAAIIIPCLLMMGYSMIKLDTHSPVKLGIDFTGGTFLQYGFEENLNTKDIPRIRAELKKIGQEGAIVQIQKPTEILGTLASQTEVKPTEAPEEENIEPASEENTEKALPEADKATEVDVKTTEEVDIVKTEETKEAPETKPAEVVVEEEVITTETLPSTDEDTNKTELNKKIDTNQTQNDKVQSVVSMRVKFLSESEVNKLNGLLRSEFGNFTVIQITAIGPSLGKELLHNAMIALLLVFGGIVAYLSFRFQVDFAVCALITLFHDAIFVIGIFSFLGKEVDSLFVTAVLTVIGFSVHDTIVVFDRIRENARFLSKKKTFNEICNDSVNQTLARSINTSLTTIFVLLCLYFLGGVTTKDFVLAMTLGIAVGTYSSIFVASVILAFWRDINAPKKRTKRKVTA